MKFEWEQLQDIRPDSFTYRAKVPRGWILHSAMGYNNSCESMVYIDDPEHKWVIDEQDSNK